VSPLDPSATQVLIRTDGGKLAAASAQNSSSSRSSRSTSCCTRCHFDISSLPYPLACLRLDAGYAVARVFGKLEARKIEAIVPTRRDALHDRLRCTRCRHLVPHGKTNAEELLWKPRFSSGHKVHPHKAFAYRSPHEFIAGGPDADRSSSACISMQTMGASGEPLSVTSLEVTVHALVPVAPSLPPAKMTDRAPSPSTYPTRLRHCYRFLRSRSCTTLPATLIGSVSRNRPTTMIR
jgi:hypothetical protein